MAIRDRIFVVGRRSKGFQRIPHVSLHELSNIDGKTSSTDEVQTTRGTDANHVAFGSSPLEEPVDENRTSTQATTIPKCKCQLLTKESLIFPCVGLNAFGIAKS
jgi:hypothetical protein